MRIFVILNPAAGRGKRQKRFDAVMMHLRRQGCDVTIVRTCGAGDAEEIVRRMVNGQYDRLVVAGGDGTVNEAVNGLMSADFQIPLAILPMGTANVLAREIGLPVRPDAIAQTIIQGRVIPIGLGNVNGRHFILMAGVGFDAHVVATLDLREKRRFGKGAYVLSAIRNWIRYRKAIYRVEVDGRSFDAASVIVTNARHYAGPYVIAPDADLADGKLDVCMFLGTGRWWIIRYGIGLLLGRLPGMPGFLIVSGHSVRISGNGTEPVQIDGDSSGQFPVDIVATGNAIGLIFPPGQVSPGTENGGEGVNNGVPVGGRQHIGATEK